MEPPVLVPPVGALGHPPAQIERPAWDQEVLQPFEDASGFFINLLAGRRRQSISTPTGAARIPRWYGRDWRWS